MNIGHLIGAGSTIAIGGAVGYGLHQLMSPDGSRDGPLGATNAVALGGLTFASGVMFGDAAFAVFKGAELSRAGTYGAVAGFAIAAGSMASHQFG